MIEGVLKVLLSRVICPLLAFIAFVEGLPDADYYLIEEMLPILPKVWFSLSLNPDQRKTS